MRRIAGLVISLIVIAGFLTFVNDRMHEADASPELSVEMVKERIGDQYPGDLKEVAFNQEKESYEVVIESKMTAYELIVDGNTGHVLQIDKKDLPKEAAIVPDEQAETSETNEPVEKNSDDEEEEREQAIISEEEAVKVAHHEFPGKVDEVELEEEDGMLRYEIEIESGETEAEILVDAYTGKVIIIEIDD